MTVSPVAGLFPFSSSSGFDSSVLSVESESCSDCGFSWLSSSKSWLPWSLSPSDSGSSWSPSSDSELPWSWGITIDGLVSFENSFKASTKSV